jgi:hypothetical protein
MSDIHALETNLDLKQNLNVYANCKQLDKLHLILNIFDDGVQVDLSNYNVRLKAMKADKIPLIQDTEYSVVNNVVTILAHEQLTTTSGVTKIELQFINKTTGEKKATFNLNLKVIASILEVERSISTITYTLLEELENKLDTAQNFIENIGKAIQINATLVTTTNNANTTNTNLSPIISEGNTLKTKLTAVNNMAITNIANLTTQNNNAVSNAEILTTKNGEANTNITNLTTENTNAANNISTLTAKNSDSVANKNNLDVSISTANATKSELTTINDTAITTKKDLIDINTNANTTKTDLIDENVRAEVNITSMKSFGDVSALSQNVTNLKTEIENARNGEVDLDTRLDKVDTQLSESAKQADLDAVALYNATCVYTTNVFTLTLAKAPTTLPNMYTVRVKTTNDWVDSSTIKIGTKTYTVSNAAFVNGDIVMINVDEVTAKCFFKSGGGGGLTETLPQQVDTFTAVAGDGVINLTWSNSNTNYLAGYYIIYKQGSVAPTTLNDGSKIDITNPSATSQQITGVTNGTQYACRIMPYNSKKQVQTQYKVLVATPSANILINNLAVGSKIKGIDPSNSQPIYFIILDKNHTGYPTNSLTLLCDDIVATMNHGATTYQYSAIDAWLNDSVSSPTKFFLRLPTYLRSILVDTNVVCATGWGSQTTIVRKAFLLSRYESIGDAVQGTIYEGTKFSFFSSDLSRLSKSGVSYWGRTPGIGTGGADSSYFGIWTTGGWLNALANQNYGIRPAFNISQNNNIYVKPLVDANGYYEII